MSDAGAEERELVRRALAGDEDAFTRLFDGEEEEIRRGLRRRLPSRVRRRVSESDLMQETRLAAYTNLRKFEYRGEGSFVRWVQRIATNKLRSLLREFGTTAKRDVNREISWDSGTMAGGLRVPDSDPSEHAANREIAALALRVLEDLDEPDREMIRLTQIDGLTIRDAGRILGRSDEAARKHLGRALERYRRELRRRVRDVGDAG